MRALDGKVVVVTGGSSGIGRATARAFAREGARVVIAARGVERGRRVVEEIASNGGTARFVRADLSGDAEMLVGRTVEAYGRLDCAFNNAGTLGERLAPTADLEAGEFDNVCGVHHERIAPPV